ncbi:hypothetical protein [Candidatus Poriferisodalis sp.]|uniref:hypothetical protein n=1 Tax=Candidatus Poriferisodalis sp. TaxID=3101277 RepID=UPI003B5B595C
MGEDRAFRISGAAAGGHDERVAGLDVPATSAAVAARGVHHHAGAHALDERLLRSGRESLIDGQDCIAGIPSSLQLRDEAITAADRQRYQSWQVFSPAAC